MCTGLPDNAIWNSVSSITQNWNPFDGWQPLTIGVYNTTESSTECRFKCDDNYFWNNSECTSPCDNDPCEGIVNSTEICVATDWNKYSCECEDSYFWDGTQCKHQKTIGNICTGQTICYNTIDEISCPTLSTEDFFGQDAHYAVQGICTPQSFTVKTTIPGQNIVVDNNTGLEWQQASPIEKDNFEDAANYCHNLNYAGINNGWRLPTAKEFLTIIDNNTLNPALDTIYFPNFQTSDSTYCWTSQFYENDIGEIWLAEVSLYYGEIRFRQTNPTCVICVHGKELPDASFTLSTSDNGDVIVTDSISDLMWQKTYETDKTWAQALSYCENLNYAGYSDWRLPNKNEMASLFNYNLGEKPYSDFPDMPSSFFWTSSTSLYNTKFAWIANFNISYLTNRVTNSVKGSTSSKYVRCVRNAE